MPRTKTATPTISLEWRNGWAYAGWSDAGRKVRRSLGTRDREAAKRALAVFRADRLNPAVKLAPLTVSDALDHYLADRLGRVRSHDSLRHAANAVKRHMGDLAARAVTRQVCRDYAAKRHQEGRGGATGRAQPLSDGTIIKDLVTLRMALRMAVKDGMLATEPHVELPAAPRGRERWMTRDEAALLLRECHTPHVRMFVLLALHTGARTGAMLELRWDAVDLQAGVIDYGAGVGNKRRGRVPVTATLRAALETAAEMRESDYVVSWRGERVASVRAAIRAATKAAGIVGVTPHIFRHTAVTWMVQAGIATAQVARFVQDSELMIEKRYGHHSPEWLAGAARALEG